MDSDSAEPTQAQISAFAPPGSASRQRIIRQTFLCESVREEVLKHCCTWPPRKLALCALASRKEMHPRGAKKPPHLLRTNPTRFRQTLFPIRRSKARRAIALRQPETLSEFAFRFRQYTCRRWQRCRT